MIVVLSFVGLVSVGCAPENFNPLEASDPHPELTAHRMAMAHIMVVDTAEIPGHKQYTELGSVTGYCERIPFSGDRQILNGGGMSIKEAAIAQYGDQVDAIVLDGHPYLLQDNSSAAPVKSHYGTFHYECTGTAVSFSAPSVATQ